MRPLAPVLVLTLALAGCGGGSDHNTRSDTITPATTKASPPAKVSSSKGQLSTLELRRAHLAVTDLPTGWTVDNDDEDNNDSSPGDEPCAHRFDDIEKLNNGASVARGSFTMGGFGPFLSQTLASYPTEDKASGVMATITKLFQECQSFKSTDPEDKTVSSFTLAPFSFPALGDRSTAVAVTIKNESASADARLVFIRSGHSIDFVALVGIGGVNASDLESIARKSLAKLNAVS